MKIFSKRCWKRRLHRLHMRLNWFLGRYVVSGELRYLRKRVNELEAGENQDIKFLRFQLTKLRAENTALQSRTDDWRTKFSELFTMTEGQLYELACHYDIWGADDAPGWFVAANNCVFCGCGLEVAALHTRRDALLYGALLHTMDYHPRHNLCCSSCYAECM